MKNKILWTLGFCATIVGFTFYLSTPAQAIVLADECPEGSQSKVCAASNPNDEIGAILGTITNVLFFIIGALAVIMIIYSGIRYTTSAGNPAGVTAAKNSLIYSVVGLVVAILAYAIVKYIVTSLSH